ncbi:hypothetical protein TNCV_2530051 [Trichonephila clavipes]|nr:hypothetical protein TNCV_2530051 [Trichonephila clavipes]
MFRSGSQFDVKPPGLNFLTIDRPIERMRGSVNLTQPTISTLDLWHGNRLVAKNRERWKELHVEIAKAQSWLDSDERVSIPKFDCCVQFKRPIRRAAGVAIYRKQ